MGNPHLSRKSGKLEYSSLRTSTRSGDQEMLPRLPGPVTVVDEGRNHESSILATSLLRQFPHVLLIECLLEKLCVSQETDPAIQRELFNTLRNYFVNFRLLPPLPATPLPGMDGVRLRIGTDLANLFRLARLQLASNNSQSTPAVGPLALVSSPSIESIWGSGDATEHLFTSRYELDFKELEFIAAGGFGVVYRARNILDNNEYAIKKIVIRPRSARKIIREVQLLSLLHHPNIVAYKSAWLEYCSAHTLREIVRRMDGTSFSTQEGGSTVNLVTSYSREYETVVTRTVESNKSDSVVFESETLSETSVTRHSHQLEETRGEMIERSAAFSGSLVQGPRWSLNMNRIVSSSALLLYIQMQLCPQTLRQWLNTRNGRSAASPVLEAIESELSIFRQIVQGIGYIHERNIIHRDIKPENIFVNEQTQQVQIGDFGLAKLGFSNEPNSTALSAAVSVMSHHRNTRGVGTHSYAAPEQLNSQESDAKSDIYSLGIVLLELLVPFQTDMERYKSIERLRKRCRLPDSLHHKWPCMAGLILEMISHDRTSRPSAAEILARLDGTTAGTGSNDNPARSEVSDRVATDVDGNSQHSVAELLSIIEDLRRQVAAKDLLIEQLTNQQ